jgi:hypothetical protein
MPVVSVSCSPLQMSVCLTNGVVSWTTWQGEQWLYIQGSLRFLPTWHTLELDADHVGHLISYVYIIYLDIESKGLLWQSDRYTLYLVTARGQVCIVSIEQIGYYALRSAWALLLQVGKETVAALDFPTVSEMWHKCQDDAQKENNTLYKYSVSHEPSLVEWPLADKMASW